MTVCHPEHSEGSARPWRRAEGLGSMTLVAAMAVCFASSATAQTIAITGGRVYPVSGPPIENATVVIVNGRITAVGAGVPVPAGATTINASGKWVTPGFINAGTALGLSEIGAVNNTNDNTARGHDSISASFRAWEGLNPNTALFPPARNDGITSVVVAPGGNLIAGQAAFVDLTVGTVSDMVRRAPVAMAAQLSDPRSGGATSRGELFARLRELLDDAKSYARRKADFEGNRTRSFIASRADLEAMIPVVEGKLPLLLDVDRASDIEVALGIAREYNLRLIVNGGSEAWMVAGKLAAAKVPVITGGIANIPLSFSTLNTRPENAMILRRAGAVVIIAGNSYGDEVTFNVRNVKYEAGNAVAAGLSWEDGLRAVTLAPAEAFGVADRLGTLQVGKDANIVVWSGDPFEFMTTAEQVIIRGQVMHTPSRQDMLMERYKTLPPDYRKP